MILRIEEALARENARRQKKIKKTELAQYLWPDSSISAARVNLWNLLAGKTQRVEPEIIISLCMALGCTADFLLGMDK